MARKKIAKASDKTTDDTGGGKTGGDAAVSRLVWGLVYTAVGTLLFISLLLYSPAQHSGAGSVPHKLGLYLGTRLALGLFYLFGRVTAFMFPVLVCYIGVVKCLSRPQPWKLFLFLAALTLELCVLLAVGRMPDIAASGLLATADSAGSNFIGLLMVKCLVPLFGAQTFGPYFIVSLCVAITLVTGLRGGLRNIIIFLSRAFGAAVSWLVKAFSSVKVSIENSPDIIPAPISNGGSGADTGRPPEPPASNSGGGNGDGSGGDDGGSDGAKKTPSKRFAKTVAVIPAVGAPGAAGFADSPNNGDTGNLDDAAGPDMAGNGSDSGPPPGGADPDSLDPDDEERKRIQAQTEEFRRKQVEPIKIVRLDTPDVEPDPDDDGIPPFDIDGADGLPPIDGSAAVGALSGGGNTASDDGEFDVGDGFKVTEYAEPAKPYVVPSPDVLPDPPPLSSMINEDAIRNNAEILENTLRNFGIEGKVISVSPGPVVTRYEIVLAPGIKISKVTGLRNDISLAVGGKAIRIQAPIPGKAAIGIELPNSEPQTVHFKHILTSEACRKGSFKLPMIVGVNISGAPYVSDITKTPHLLIAGQTGSGKSVGINSLIGGLLMTKKPEELRLIMIDPKIVEFAVYENIPHLLAPVVNAPDEAVKALQWAVIEMERRYALIRDARVRKIDDFNTKVESGELAEVLSEENNKKLPYIVIIIDELADFMAVAPKDIDVNIARLGAKARAAGIHLILATQRPEVKVISGAIKANLPSRIAFRTVQSNDSVTILGQGGAETLLGNGDMLFYRNGAPDVERFHGTYISDDDVEKIVASIKEQQVSVDKINSFHDVVDDPNDVGGGPDKDRGVGKRDEFFNEAAKTVVSLGFGSTSQLQRQMEIGFARAGRIMDQLERAGIVGPSKGSKPREVLVRPDELGDYL